MSNYSSTQIKLVSISILSQDLATSMCFFLPLWYYQSDLLLENRPVKMFYPFQERMLKAIMGKPTAQQASLERFIMSLDEAKQGWGLFWLR